MWWFKDVAVKMGKRGLKRERCIIVRIICNKKVKQMKTVTHKLNSLFEFWVEVKLKVILDIMRFSM